MSYRHAAAALVMGLLTGIVPVMQAQAPDPALIKTVSEAFAKTQAATSLHRDSQSVTQASGLPQGLSIGQSSKESVDVSRNGDTLNASGTRTLSLTMPNGETTLTTEYVLLDTAAYVRFTDVPAEMQADLPGTWVDASTLTPPQNAQPGSDRRTGRQMVADLSDLSSRLLAELSLPITESSVTQIKPLADAVIANQTVKVYQITLDSAAVLDSEAASLLDVQFGAGGGMGAPDGQGFPGAQGGAALPTGTPPAMPTLSPDDIQMTFAVSIGPDGYVWSLYSVIATTTTMTSPMGDLSLALTMTTQTNYSAFNLPVEITAPELGS